MRHAATAFVLVAAGCLGVPACAAGATVVGSASTGPAAEDFIDFRADKGEENRVRVRIGKDSVTIVDRGVARLKLHRTSIFHPCRRAGPRKVVCLREPVAAQLGDRDDTFVAFPRGPGSDHPHQNPLALQEDYADHDGAILETTIVDGGSGDDSIQGSSFRDTISPGPGRDRVEGRGGPDTVFLVPDGRYDRADGGGGVDTLSFLGYPDADVPVTVDLRAGTAGAAGERGEVAGFERVHGGRKRDVLRGSSQADALYGEYGRDEIHGGGGNDLLVGDSPVIENAFPNVIFGGAGDDLIDERGYSGAHPPSSAHRTSRLSCGSGTDRELGETDDFVDRSCERAVFRVPDYYRPVEQVRYGTTADIWPVASDADGSPTYALKCPALDGATSCTVDILLEAPPFGGEAPQETYGSGHAILEPGTRGQVHVALNDLGRQAVERGDPVDVDVSERVERFEQPSLDGAFGWEQVLPRP